MKEGEGESRILFLNNNSIKIVIDQFEFQSNEVNLTFNDILHEAEMYSQVGVGRRGNAKTHTSGHSITGIKSFQLAAKEMSCKAKTAGVLIKNGHQVVRNNVLIRV
jgi:hypothetical protein